MHSNTCDARCKILCNPVGALAVERNLTCFKQTSKDTYWSIHSIAQQWSWQDSIVLPKLQGHSAGLQSGLDPAQLQQLASENSTLQHQVAQLTQQLYQGEFRQGTPSGHTIDGGHVHLF